MGKTIQTTMLTAQTAVFASVLFLAALVPALADYGPYEESTDYDLGQFGAWPTESYRSSPVIGPSLNFLQHSTFCDDGLYTVLAPSGRTVRTPGPMIIDQEGHLVWTKQYGRTENVNVYGYKDASYLTFCVGDDFVAGYGDASTCYMVRVCVRPCADITDNHQLDSSYEEVYKIRSANGLAVDLHDFHITRDGTALVTVSDPVPFDLTPVAGSADGWIFDGTFQEIDIETGSLLFQWQASKHFNITDKYPGPEDVGGTQEQPWDFFHITSVDKDSAGNFLVASSYLNALVYIDGHSGDVLWTLGGKNSDFDDLSDNQATSFTKPSNARFVDGSPTSVTLFDASPISRGVHLTLSTNPDDDTKTASLTSQYLNPQTLSPASGGSTQILPSSNVLVSYGTSAAWTEYTADGMPVCEVHFGSAYTFNEGFISTNLVTKHAWTGTPKSKPSLTLWGYEASVSWNGATDVLTWALEGSHSIPRSSSSSTDDHNNTDPEMVAGEEEEEEIKYFTLLTAQPKAGYETTLSIPIRNTYPILRAVAIDITGKRVGSSLPVAWNPTAEEIEQAGGIPPGRGWWLFLYFVVGFLSAAALGVVVWVVVRRKERVRLEIGEGEYEWLRRGGWRSVKDPVFNGDEEVSEDEVGLLGHQRSGQEEGEEDRCYPGEESGSGSESADEGGVEKI